MDGTTTLVWNNIGMYADGDPDFDADEMVTLTFTVRSTIYGMGLNVQVANQAKVDYYDAGMAYIGSVPIPQATINVHPYETDLIAGGGNVKSAIDVGEVIAWNDEDYLYVKYVTTDGWFMTETHLDVVVDPSDFPLTKKGNPVPGQFQYKDVHYPAEQEVLYKVPWDPNWDPGTVLHIAAHAVVQKAVGIDADGLPIYQEETAWADGEDFPGRNWATYFMYEDP
jgi:hypothetical protein